MAMKVIGLFVFAVLMLLGTLSMQGKLSVDEQVTSKVLNLPTAKVMFLSKDIIRLETPDLGVWYVNFNSASGKPVAERDIIVTSFQGGQQVPVAMKLSEATKFFSDKARVGPDDWARIERLLRQ
jgi:hypothetical protein